MYRNSTQVFEGFTKNLLAGFGCIGCAEFLLIWLWIGIVFLNHPIYTVLIAARPAALNLLGGDGDDEGSSLPCYCGACRTRGGFTLYLALFYPVTIVLALFMAARSVAFTVHGRFHVKRTAPWCGHGDDGGKEGPRTLTLGQVCNWPLDMCWVNFIPGGCSFTVAALRLSAGRSASCERTLLHYHALGAI